MSDFVCALENICDLADICMYKDFARGMAVLSEKEVRIQAFERKVSQDIDRLVEGETLVGDPIKKVQASLRVLKELRDAMHRRKCVAFETCRKLDMYRKNALMVARDPNNASYKNVLAYIGMAEEIVAEQNEKVNVKIAYVDRRLSISTTLLAELNIKS